MMIVWTMVIVLSTNPFINLALVSEYRSEDDCLKAIKVSVLEDELKKKLKCLAIGYESV